MVQVLPLPQLEHPESSWPVEPVRAVSLVSHAGKKSHHGGMKECTKERTEFSDMTFLLSIVGVLGTRIRSCAEFFPF